LLVEAVVIFGFDSGQDASRFLNRLKVGVVPGVVGRLQRGGMAVAVAYALNERVSFDGTCAALDDLAREMGGVCVEER
jgi:signal recognition particle GTPase